MFWNAYGAGKDFLFLLTEDGLNSVSKEGTISPIIKWDKYQFNLWQVYEIIPSATSGKFICNNVMGLYRLKQAAASENNARTELKIAAIGQPTLDGSCGSDVYVQDTVGILICGSNIEGCWELVKFMLENYGSTDDSLPVYMPLLRKEIDDAKNSTDLQVTFNDRDAEKFLNLFEKVNNTACVRISRFRPDFQ